MDDFSDKISSLLSDPESMGKILNAVKAISGTDQSSRNEKNKSESVPDIVEALAGNELQNGDAIREDKKNPFSAILSSPELEKLFGNGNKERCALLMSMRPFLESSKRDKIDEIVRTLKLIDMFYGAKEFL
ncbi:MAG: hypothetical protein E7665_02140 [Ruminococcaceae bacterium]|nr:hypothetical protein [Oscillospiraceae bacterium]